MQSKYLKQELYDQASIESLQESYRNVLTQIGEDPEREGLVKTPERVAKSMLFMTQGYSQDGLAIINSAKFQEEYKQMIIV